MEKMELRRTVGLEIRRYRMEQGLSLHQLAGMSGTSYTHLWKVENAKVGVGLVLLGRIAEALDVPLRDIVDPDPHDRMTPAGKVVPLEARMEALWSRSVVLEYDGR